MKRYYLDAGRTKTSMDEHPDGRWVWYAEAQERIDDLETKLDGAKKLLIASQSMLSQWVNKALREKGWPEIDDE